MDSRHTSIVFAAAALLCAACADDTNVNNPAQGIDMSDAQDSGEDDVDAGGGEDASMSVGEDAGVDAEMDADMDAYADADADAEDAGADADADADAAMDAGADIDDMADLAVADMGVDMDTEMPPACSGSVVPSGYRTVTTTSFRRNLDSFSASNYEEFLGAYPMDPNFSGATYRVAIGSDTILTMPFTVPTDADPDTYVWLNWVFFIGTADSTRVTVSPCPGGVLEADTVPQPPGKSCIGQGGMGGGDLTYGRATDAKCVLEPGDYYLNIVHLDRNDATGCPDFSCEWRVQPRLINLTP